MFESKAQLKKKIEQLKEEAYKRELYISDMHTALRISKDSYNKLSEDAKALTEENKQLHQENVDLLLRMRKILKDER